MIQRFNNLPIGRRLSLLVVVISAVTLAFVVYIALISTTQTLRNEAFATLQDQNESIANSIDRRLYGNSIVLNRIRNSVSFDEQVTEANIRKSVEDIMRMESNLLMQRITFYIPGLDVVYYNFIDPSTGRSAVYNTRRAENVSEDEWFMQAMEHSGLTWYGPAQESFTNSLEPVISVGVTYNNVTTKQTGLIWADISVSSLRQMLRQTITLEAFLSPDNPGYSFLTNQEGRVVAIYNTRLDDTDLMDIFAEVQFNEVTPMDELLISGERGAIAINSPMLETGWQLTTVLPYSALPILPRLTILQIALISFGGILAMILTINRFVFNTVANPIDSLSNSAQKIGAGQLTTHVPYQTQMDEIGVLARAMEEMRSDLQQSYDTLEQRVIERTLELDIARQQAQETALELRAVYDESISVVSDYHLQNILQTFTQRILPLLGADYCGVWLLRTNGEELRLIAHTSPDESLNGITINLGEGLVGLTTQTAQPMLVDDYHAWPNRLMLSNLSVLARAMCVPLLSSGQAIGAVIVGRAADKIGFLERDQRLLTLFANMVSPSVRNAQLFVQLDDARKVADRANQVKTRFLASVTHELRTPLNLIINNMDFMRIGAFGDVTEEQGTRLDQTIRSAEHLLYMINDLLDVSKIEAGEMQLFIQPTDPYPVLEDALDSAMMLVEKNDKATKVTINADIPEGIPLVPMDARRIRQVLYNLLSNAIKFTLEGDVEFKVEVKEDLLRFSVKDTGIGIPPEELDKLFQAFERTERAKQLGIEGTGLGLPISRHLVQQHGGDLEVHSEYGVGSEFVFTLPLTPVSHGRRTNTQLMTAVQRDQA